MRIPQHVKGLLRARRLAPRIDSAVRPLSLGRGPLGHWAEWRRDAVALLGRATSAGDATAVQLAYEPVVVLNHPDAFEEVLVTRAESFDRAPFAAAIVARQLGVNMLTSNGSTWQRHREMAKPSFHPKMVDRMLESFVNDAPALLDDWRRFAESGTELDLARESMRITARLSARALLGLELTYDEAGALVDAVVAAQRFLFHSMTEIVPSFAPPAVKEGLALLDALAARALATRARASGPPTYLERIRQDSSFSPQEARDQVMLMLVGAPENPSNSLAWAAWLLARHPDHERALCDELDRALAGRTPTVTELEALPVLDRVLSEVLRLYPGAWIIERQARTDELIAGLRVPAGVTVVLSPYFLHRHAGFWPEPNRFEPDRFVPERASGRPRFAYLPFGAGPRVCIGARLALLEVKLLLVLLLQRFRVEPRAAEDLPVEGLFALRARHGVPVRLSARP